MMRALSVVGGSSVMDSQTSPCSCVDALPTTSVNPKSGDVILWRNSIGKKLIVKSGTMDLRSSFIGPGREWRLSVTRSSKKQRKDRKLAIVNELGGQYEDTFGDVKAVDMEGLMSRDPFPLSATVMRDLLRLLQSSLDVNTEHKIIWLTYIALRIDVAHLKTSLIIRHYRMRLQEDCSIPQPWNNVSSIKVIKFKRVFIVV